MLLRAAGLCVPKPSRDRGDEHDFVAILKGIGLPAQEPDVFVVDVDVDETAELTLLILDVCAERGEGVVDVGEQSGQVRGGGVEVLLAFGVADEGSGQCHFDGHQ